MAIMLLSEAPPGTTATLTVKVWGETGATVDHQTTVYLTSSQWPCQPVAFSQSPLVLPALPSNWAGPLVVVNSPETVAVMRHLPKTTWGRERKTFPPQFKGASIREGKAQQQEFEPAGHTASPVPLPGSRKKCGWSSLSPFYSDQRPPAYGMMLLKFRAHPPSSGRPP